MTLRYGVGASGDEIIAGNLQQHTIRSQGLTLNLLSVGDANAPTLMMLHGLRDTAHALVPMVEAHLADSYRCLLLEQRGHGASDKTAAYAMHNFILDVHNAAEALGLPDFALFGHSLGGHIATKYAALFPEKVSALVLVEGLGPPRRPHEGDAALELQAYRNMLLSRTNPPDPRPIKSLEEVAARLLRNNPRMDRELATGIAPHMVRSTDDGYVWSFDNLANSVFIGNTQRDNARFWRAVSCPTCIVTGRLSFEYWGRQMTGDGFDGSFREGEMESRVAEFQRAEHHWFDHSGHMVHYDEADRLGQLTRHFLDTHHNN